MNGLARTAAHYNAAVEGSFELFDHTADMGIRVRAETRARLIAPAVAGLYAAIGELEAGSGASKSFRFDEKGADEAILLRDFLTELLVLFERDQRILTAIQSTQFSDGQLSVLGESGPLDGERSALFREVKAITYHDLSIRDVPGGYEATMIVDI